MQEICSFRVDGLSTLLLMTIKDRKNIDYKTFKNKAKTNVSALIMMDRNKLS